MKDNLFLNKINDSSKRHMLFSITESEIIDAINLLETKDVTLRYYLGDLIYFQGKKSIPGLLEALHSPLPEIRRSAVFLLGKTLIKYPDLMATESLLLSLQDEDPKTRKNAAIVIGRLGIKGSAGKLIEALVKETTEWVKTSMLLATGAIGGKEAREFLIGYQATAGQEQEALTLALDHVSDKVESEWHFKDLLPSPLCVELWTLNGLEKILVEEAREKLKISSKIIGNGVLETKYAKLPELYSLRTLSELLIPFYSSKINNFEDCLFHIEKLFSNDSFVKDIFACHEKAESSIRYRVEVRGGKINRNLRRQLIEKTINTIRTPLFVNSPSNYDIELRLIWERDNLKVLWKPFTIVDNRFQYRVRDIAASVNPVVAAGIVRFLKSKVKFSNSSRILDPFCGSATMLVERALAGDYQELVGVDISKNAIEAAKENINKSQLEKVVIENKDMRDIEKTDFFDEIISNMPFGIRTGNHTSNEKLYRDFFNLVSNILKPKGFLALYTQEIKLTNQLFVDFIDDFSLIETQRIESGGLRPVLFIATKK